MDIPLSPMIDHGFTHSKLNRWLEQIVKKYDRGRITPNQLTISALFLGLLASGFVYLSGISPISWEIIYLVLGEFALATSFILDVFDGILARNRNPTVFGGILDIFCDRTVEISILIAIVSTAPSYLLWSGLFSLASIVLCITIFLLMGSVQTERIPEEKKVIFYTHGIMERTETGIFLLVLIAVPFPLFRMSILWIFFGLVLLTALQRLYIAYRVLSNSIRIKHK